jgi:hypothetical protein
VKLAFLLLELEAHQMSDRTQSASFLPPVDPSLIESHCGARGRESEEVVSKQTSVPTLV